MSLYKKLYPVEKMCQVLKVSSSGYYSWKRGDSNLRRNREIDLLKRIEIIYHKSLRPMVVQGCLLS